MITPFSEDERSLVDTPFLHYRLQEKLGEGGTSWVYRAYSPSLDHHRAIKFLLPRFAGDPEMTARLLREARAIAAIRHPNIVTVFDCGESPRPHGPYVVMELLSGETLRARLARVGALETPAMLAMSLQIVAALLEIHARGLAHRDIKPENFLLVQDLCKLIDFGLVKIPGEALTEVGSLLGTPAYMSPEQCAGGVLGVDSRSDLYQLGLVFYETLTGEPLFLEKDPRKLLLLHQKSTPSLGKLRNQPAALRSLVGRMLRKAAKDRPSLHEIKRTLERLSRPKRWAAVVLPAALISMAALFAGNSEYQYRDLLLRGASDTRRVAATHLKMGRGTDEQKKQFREGRPEVLKSLLAQRQPVREVDLPSSEVEVTEVVRQQFLNWVNSRWFVHARSEKTGPMTGRYLVDWKGEKLADRDLEGCAIEEDGLFHFKLSANCNPMVPIEGVFPKAAQAYCRSIGRHLITEEQWEQAARSGNDPADDYPWGPTPPVCSGQAFDEMASVPGLVPECLKETPALADVRDPTKDVSKDGIKHLFGNASEITATRYVNADEPDTLKNLYYVVRGTNVGSIREQGYVTYRSRIPADVARARTSFRCAK